MQGVAASVTVLGKDRVPFLSSLGEEVGGHILATHKEKGVQFCLEEQVAAFQGRERVESVLLQSGRTLVADIVVIGVGVVPNTQNLENIKGLDLDSSGYIPVSESMAISLAGVWAAGDVTTFPLSTYGGVRARVGHWGLAMYLGRVAALNMLGRESKAHTTPFFWTQQFGKSLRYAGYGSGWDSCVVETEPEGSLLAWYMKEEVVVAVATLGRDPVASHFANFVKEGGTLRKEDTEQWIKDLKKSS